MTKQQWLAKKRRLAAWVLRYDGMTYKQVGEAMRTSTEHARQMVKRAEHDNEWFRIYDEYHG